LMRSLWKFRARLSVSWSPTMTTTKLPKLNPFASV
jgi:hypothetical protein